MSKPSSIFFLVCSLFLLRLDCSNPLNKADNQISLYPNVETNITETQDDSKQIKPVSSLRKGGALLQVRDNRFNATGDSLDESIAANSTQANTTNTTNTTATNNSTTNSTNLPLNSKNLTVTYSRSIAVGIFFILIAALVLVKMVYIHFPIENTQFLDNLKAVSVATFPYLMVFLLFSFISLLVMSNTVNISILNFVNIISIFFLVMFATGTLISLFCSFISRNWEAIEKKSGNSFTFTKSRYEREAANIDTAKETTPEIQECFEIFEFLLMKSYFINPVYCTFKPSFLRKEFSLSKYLSKSITLQLKRLFRLSLLGWIGFLFVIMILEVLVTASPLSKILFITLFPVLLCLLALGMKLYLNEIYRRIIKKVSDYDSTGFNQAMETTSYIGGDNPPLYLKKYLTAKEDKFEVESHLINNHFMVRGPSLYESVLSFGIFGKYTIELALQIIMLSGISSISVLITRDISVFNDAFGLWTTPFYTIFALLFIGLSSYLLSLNLNLLTLYSSLEMSKDQTIIDSCIDDQTKSSAQLYNKIYNSFKMIYFDKEEIETKANNSDLVANKLKNKSLIYLIDYQYRLFISYKLKLTGLSDQEISQMDLDNEEIILEEELSCFLNTCGNFLTKDDIEFMLHFVERKNDSEKSNKLTISKRELYDVLGSMLYFKEKHPFELVKGVITDYLITLNLEKDSMIPISILIGFFDDFLEYFDKEALKLVHEDLQYYKEISLNSFVQMIVSNRRYYEN